MKWHFLMRQEQRDRIDVLKSVRKKVMRLKEAAVVLGISYRQCQRIYKRYVEAGSPGLIHRLIGRESNRAINPGPREAILERYKQRCPDFGPTLAAEKLSLDGYKRIDHGTLRQWLVKEGLWHKRRKRSGHRTWRQRRAHFRELVQMDGVVQTGIIV
jgi:transposase